MKDDPKEIREDATQHGEFISSYFAWVPLQKQKEKAKKMAKMTIKEDGKGKREEKNDI